MKTIQFIQTEREEYFLKKYLPYKMTMITIKSEDFEDYFINRYIQTNIEKKNTHQKYPKIQVKLENIEISVFPKAKEYNDILTNFFKGESKKIELFQRIKYLDPKDINIKKIIKDKSTFFNYYYNNTINEINQEKIYNSMYDESSYAKEIGENYNSIFKESNTELDKGKNSYIEKINSIYNFNYSIESDDNLLNYLFNKDKGFKINYLFRNYIPSYYDYKKDTTSNNIFEIDNYKLKNWYSLRNDYVSECLKYIIDSENTFYQYLYNYCQEETVKQNNYEFSLRKPLLLLPLKYEKDGNYFFHRSFENLFPYKNPSFPKRSIKYKLGDIHQLMLKDDHKEKESDYLVERFFKNSSEFYNYYIEQSRTNESYINGKLFSVPNMDYEKIYNEDKILLFNINESPVNHVSSINDNENIELIESPSIDRFKNKLRYERCHIEEFQNFHSNKKKFCYIQPNESDNHKKM